MTLASLDALGPKGSHRARTPEVVLDAAGTPVAELSLVPRLFVIRAMADLRRTTPLPVDDRRAGLERAATLFRDADLAGLGFDEYVELTRRTAGLPADVARAGADAVADGLANAFAAVEPARPTGSAWNWREQRRGGAWVRRGEVLAVHAPGNAPGVHGAWPQALALGYRVAVRPSRREPFTAHRAVLALRAAGFRDSDALYLPTDHTVADELVGAADRALVYGGQDVADRYSADPTVLVNGPGRTKILITAEQDWRDHVDVVVDSIANLAGMACVNTTAVLYEGDPRPLARAVADRLAELPDAALPTVPVARARALATFLADRAVGTTALLGADQIVAERDGYAVLRPALHVLDRPAVGVVDVELPFPCAWVAGWSRADGGTALRDSLVVTAITDDDALIDALLAEPTITNVYRGPVPTHFTDPRVPHDGYLADFLMRSKGFVRL
jgi:acyl-CoA reductase-like NAD-dependent aldehyde dehydrogenase